jgi:hypothetical protein
MFSNDRTPQAHVDAFRELQRLQMIDNRNRRDLALYLARGR